MMVRMMKGDPSETWDEIKEVALRTVTLVRRFRVLGHSFK
jgi:hypothetical protein